jgi:hypothetical protein
MCLSKEEGRLRKQQTRKKLKTERLVWREKRLEKTN